MKKALLIIIILSLAIFITYKLFTIYAATQFIESRVNNKGNKYPDFFTIAFFKSCNIGKSNCECVLNYLEEHFSYNDFLNDKNQNDFRLTEAANYCKK